MAGFMIFVGGNRAEDSLARIASSGVYAALLRPLLATPSGGLRWTDSHEGTFADYSTAGVGDLVFFFMRRRIYGVGRLVAIGPSPSVLNFPGASEPIDYEYAAIRDQLVWDEGETSVLQRWICTFVPDPAVFRTGVDIDDVLPPNLTSYRALRAMDSVTFGRMDDQEAQALKDAVLQANEDHIRSGIPAASCFPDNSTASHRAISSRLTTDYTLQPSPILSACAIGDRLSHEKALEAGVVSQLVAKDPETIKVFGEWDFVSHQVLASPFKPLGWADRMDVFGYSFLPGFRPTISRYFTAELKRDDATVDDIDQVMKYVDWVKDEYANGNYGMIRAFLVAAHFPQPVLGRLHEEGGRRIYTLGRRPAQLRTWEALRLIRYAVRDGLLRFEDLTPN